MRDDLEEMPPEKPIEWYLAKDGAAVRAFDRCRDDEVQRTRAPADR
jgi:hypothetical protein